MIKPCWKPSVEGDGLLWYKDLGHHVHGEFSMATIQANSLMEDQSQLESGPLSWTDSGPQGTFVGVCDGHGGTEASRFVNDKLFCNLKRYATEHQGISENVIEKAFSATEENFLSLVKKQWLSKPQIASAGSCCLVGIICNGLLHIANVGDSRVVLGRAERGTREVTAIQLSTEHNANMESVREELRSMHPHDSQIVVLKHKIWRVKGLIQVSRSIGDAYLKKAEFNKEPLLPRFRLPEPFLKPVLSSEPSISVHKLHPEDQFLIFASDGLWEHLSNQEAVNIVVNYPRYGIARRLVKAALQEAAKKREMRYSDQFLIFASDGLWEHLSNQEAVNIVVNYPRYGIARRLVKAALQEAAKKREMRYSDLKTIDRGVRRHFHDDIAVIVVFINPHSIHGSPLHSSPLSIKGGGGVPATASSSSSGPLARKICDNQLQFLDKK